MHAAAGLTTWLRFEAPFCESICSNHSTNVAERGDALCNGNARNTKPYLMARCAALDDAGRVCDA